jgi:hypothetical protein
MSISTCYAYETWLSITGHGWGDTDHPVAWQAVFTAIETGWLSQDDVPTLLHHAVQLCSVGTLRYVLQLGLPPSSRDEDGWLPMHYAAKSRRGALEKCKLLPVTDLACRTVGTNETPLHVLAQFLRRLLTPSVDPDAVALLQVFQWMVEQPECPLDAVNSDGKTAGDYLSGCGAHFARPLAMLQAAQAARARWTPLRTAWTGAVVTGSCKK